MFNVLNLMSNVFKIRRHIHTKMRLIRIKTEIKANYFVETQLQNFNDSLFYVQPHYKCTNALLAKSQTMKILCVWPRRRIVIDFPFLWSCTRACPIRWAVARSLCCYGPVLDHIDASRKPSGMSLVPSFIACMWEVALAIFDSSTM
jgi:hypothetical protein